MRKIEIIQCRLCFGRMMQWMRAGRELRQLADAFSRSKERHEVRRKAENVPLEALDAEYFLHLLQELFQVSFLLVFVCFKKELYGRLISYTICILGWGNHARENHCPVFLLCGRRHSSSEEWISFYFS